MDIDIDPTAILEETSIKALERELIELSIRYAILGRIDIARELMSLYYTTPPSGDMRIIERSLLLAWETTV